MEAKIGDGARARGRRGEKRHLAILFADLADSTRICAEMGAEEFHAIIDDFLRCAAAAVEAEGGYVARFMGDGLLAYFGYPAAAEDDSIRAIRAALSIRSAVANLAKVADTALAVRSGIATGAVVLGQWLGEGPARERPVFGDAANLAARLQSVAVHNSVFVSEPTYRLAQSSFLFEEHATLALKGIEGATRAFEVVGANGWEHRPWAGGGSRGPMIGRVAELDTIRGDFAAAHNGNVQRVMIVGEAGIGKSTLVAALLAELDGSSFRLAVAAANPSFANLPFFMARQLFNDDPFVAGRTPGTGDPETVAEYALSQLLAREGAGPLVVLAEDLHWADPSSLDFLTRIARLAPSSGLLLLCTSRPPLPTALAGACFRTIGLSRLGEADMLDLIRQVLSTGRSVDMSSKIVERADGIPLFGIELARHLAETDDRPSTSLPWSLSELLAARLSDLRESLRLAQCLAVLGISGELDLLARLAEMTPGEADEAARALQAAGAARFEFLNGSPCLVLSHALVRDALYDMLFAHDRKALHRRAAMLLELGDLASLDDLAQHWAAADEPARAAATYAKAGERHRLQYGYREAEHAFDLGLLAVARVRPSPLRDRIELELQSSLASVLQISQGYSTRRAKAAASRAQILAERQGELTQRFAGLAGQWMAASSAGEYSIAETKAQQLLSLATSVGGEELLATAWMTQLTSRFRMGDLEGAERAFVAGQPYYPTMSFAARPGAIAQTYGNAALVAVLLGDPAAARSRAVFAIRNGRRIRSDYDICFASYMVGMLCLMLGADRGAQRWSVRTLRLATRIGFPQFASIAQVVLGRAMAGLGDLAIGVEMIRSGIDAMEATNSKVGLTLYLSWLAEAECFANQKDEAAATLERALSANPEERFYLPETLRLKSRLLPAQCGAGEAARIMDQSKHLAEGMGGEWFLRRLKIEDRPTISPMTA